MSRYFKGLKRMKIAGKTGCLTFQRDETKEGFYTLMTGYAIYTARTKKEVYVVMQPLLIYVQASVRKRTGAHQNDRLKFKKLNPFNCNAVF